MLEKWRELKSEEKVELTYPEGILLVSKKDFNRAFGAIINAPYEAVKRDFALS